MPKCSNCDFFGDFEEIDDAVADDAFEQGYISEEMAVDLKDGNILVCPECGYLDPEHL